MFEIIPAIDLLDGQVVRLHKGDYDQKKVYSNDPPAFAREFVSAGARWIHVVDLNSARNGERSVNRSVLRDIVQASGDARLQTGGGIRSGADIEEVLSLGISRVILGTRAARSPGDIAGWISNFGADKIVIGVDVAGDRIRVQGWEEDGGYSTSDFLALLESAGARLIVATNISSDGTLEGVDLEFYKRITDASRLEFVVSGGVAGIQDVVNLKQWNHPQIHGMIVGKAYYEGRMDLVEAVRLAST